MPLRLMLLPVLAIVTITLPPQAGFAADSDSFTSPRTSAPARTAPAAPATNPDYAAGKTALQAGNYAGAMEHFQRVVAREPRNADALNYLGYSNRKMGHYTESMAYYEKALTVDPDHKGALEYQGELFLTLRDLPKAEANLARLDNVCTFGCDEYSELKAAIDTYKNGGRVSVRKW